MWKSKKERNDNDNQNQHLMTHEMLLYQLGKSILNGSDYNFYNGKLKREKDMYFYWLK